MRYILSYSDARVVPEPRPSPLFAPVRRRSTWAKGLALMVLVLLLSACAPLFPTPNDFPTPPWTPIVEFPTPAFQPTVTPPPLPRPILESDMVAARNFFLVTKTAAAAGDDTLIAERVLYPLRVNMRGAPMVIPSAAEFRDNYQKIFDQAFIQVLYSADENDLVVLPDGISAANGALRFNLFCMDAVCSQTQFLITQINK